MNAPKFTPGPWHVIRAPSSQPDILPSIDADDDAGEVACGVINDADANLIAAAPELLEALTDLLDNAADIDVSAESDDCALSDFVRSMDKARAAIAKAQGGAP